MIHIVHLSYVPNTASTNRLLSYLYNIPLHINIKLYFLLPDSQRSEIKELPKNIQITYCWKKFEPIHRLLTPFTYHCSLRYIRKQLNCGDIVYCYNIPHFINSLFKKGVRFFGERTESPEVVTSPSRLVPFTLKKHLKLCKKLDGIFVISTALQDYYSSHGICKDKIRIINMTVDPQRFIHLSKGSPDHKYIAYCGNLSNTKDGLDKLIKSFALISNEFPDLYLYIVGQGSKEDQASYKKLICELGIIGKVVFTGSVDSEAMPQILKDAEICALARPDSLQSRCGFPTKLGEYLLTKNPVVVTDVGDIVLFLQDNVSALIASSDDDDDFASKLKWAIQNPIEARKIGENGYEIALKYFNAKAEVQKMLNFMMR